MIPSQSSAPVSMGGGIEMYAASRLSRCTSSSSTLDGHLNPAGIGRVMWGSYQTNTVSNSFKIPESRHPEISADRKQVSFLGFAFEITYEQITLGLNR